MAIFETDGINIYYEDIGNIKSENCIVLLNGGMSNTASWGLLYPVFERIGWRIVLHDFKGQLKSDKPTGPYTFKEHAKEAKALFDHLGLDEVHVIGTSYGARVAMEFALMYPRATRSLSIISSLSESDACFDKQVAGWKKRCVLGNGGNFFWSVVPTFYGKSFLEKNLESCKQRAEFIDAADAVFFVGQKAIFDTLATDINVTERLPAISSPTLVVVGMEDQLTPIKFSEIISQNIQDAEFITIPDCGHLTIAEKPKELESIVLGFVIKHAF